jgi:hypothetical protein
MAVPLKACSSSLHNIKSKWDANRTPKVKIAFSFEYNWLKDGKE